jgi:hypothetical protein
MQDDRRLKRYLLVGAIIGGLMSVAISLLMDTLFADSLNGTWRDAIVSDLNNFFKVQVATSSPLVFIVLGVILLVLGGFGAFMGIIFTFFIYKFFSFLKG